MSYSRKNQTAQKKQLKSEDGRKPVPAKKTSSDKLINEKKIKKYKFRGLNSYYEEEE